jgi:hypothetical protein
MENVGTLFWPFGIFDNYLVYLMAIWYIFGHLVYIFPFWYVAPRKIWQPWIQLSHNVLIGKHVEKSLNLTGRGEASPAA